MKYLKIQNKGVLDVRLVALMGGTTKANDAYKIGQFGTGLKYTLAYAFRNNVDFHIFCGEDHIDLSTETEVIKGEPFEIICIQKNRTSITTKMGLEWKAWMIIRELWCNALDEGEAFKEEATELVGAPEITTFYIQITPDIKEVMDNWTKYFVHTQEPMFADANHAIYPGGETLRIYKQGVLIKESNQKALYAYDLKNAEINELREFMGSTDHLVFKCLQNTSDKVINHFLSNVKEDMFEGRCDYNWFENWGSNWKQSLATAKLIHPEAVKNIKARGIDIDTSSMVVVPENVFKSLTKQFEGISALRMSAKVNEFYESFNSELEMRVKSALVILENANYDFSPELKFVYGVFGAKNIMAQVNMDTKEVLISENMVSSSLFEIAAMLIEESEHFKTGFVDCSRPFQQHFINMYARQLFKNAKVEI